MGDEYYLPEDADQQQFHQEWQQWDEAQAEALEDYLTALANYYGNQREQS